jgi:hypothetical protein
MNIVREVLIMLCVCSLVLLITAQIIGYYNPASVADLEFATVLFGTMFGVSTLAYLATVFTHRR